MTPILSPSLGGFLTPMQPTTSVNEIREVSASFIPIKKIELFNKISGQGLRVEFRFTRSQHLINSAMVCMELTFYNESNKTIKNVHIANEV